MNLVSYSLYGTSAKYIEGAIRNAKTTPKVLPGWKCRFYVAEEIPKKYLNQLIELGSEVITCETSIGSSGMFWRYRAIDDKNYEFVIFRDTDSVIDLREADAINEWVKSGKSIHIIRDHPQHDVPILGGLWGVRNGAIPTFLDALVRYTPNGYYGEDQEFLTKHVYKTNRNKIMIHDSFFKREGGTYKFRLERTNLSYCGESIDEFGNIDKELRNLVYMAEKDGLLKKKLYLKSRLKAILGR